MTFLNRLVGPTLLGAAYFVAAAAAVLLTRFDGGVAFVWVATALLAAELMTRPRHNWPWAIVPCAIASTLVTGLWGLGWGLALPFMAINMIEAMVAAWLFRQFVDAHRPLGSLGWLMHFVASIGLVAPIVAGFLATAVLAAAGHPAANTFVTFVTGHALGNLTFTPIALLLVRRNRPGLFRDFARRDPIETVALLMLVVATIGFVFSQSTLPILFLPLLPMILVAFRVGRGGVALSIAMLAVIGVLATVTGQGPVQMVGATMGDHVHFFQFYLAAMVLSLLPITADLENRSRLHRKLRESEAGYRLIAEYSSDIIFNLRIDGTIRYVSNSCRQLGYEPRQLIGRNCMMLIAPEHLEEATAAHLRSLKLAGATNRFEYFALAASGEKRWCETHARLITDDQGQPHSILSIVRDIHAQKEVEAALARAALADPLTGLDNRLGYRQSIERRQAEGRSGACVAVLDIDHFKAVNDRFGHDAGDIVLRGFADVARRIVREGDVVARIGGEEFAIFFPDTAIDQALKVCDRLRSALGATMFQAGTQSINVTVSGGVAELGPDGIDAALKIADMALYRAKQAGRNQLALAA